MTSQDTLDDTDKELTEASTKDHLHTASAPIYAAYEKPKRKLKTQISAPFYLRSLAENNLPPFQKPSKEPRPALLVAGDSLVVEDDIVHIVAAAEAEPQHGMRKYLARLLVNKKIVQCYELSERDFLANLLCETIDYAAQRDFSAAKVACLFDVYLSTHLYFKWYYWSSPTALWHYFKDLMIRHTVETTPDGTEVFDPDECYDVVTHFHTVYMSNLPLIHIATYGAHRLKLNWPFKMK